MKNAHVTTSRGRLFVTISDAEGNEKTHYCPLAIDAARLILGCTSVYYDFDTVSDMLIERIKTRVAEITPKAEKMETAPSGKTLRVKVIYRSDRGGFTREYSFVAFNVTGRTVRASAAETARMYQMAAEMSIELEANMTAAGWAEQGGIWYAPLTAPGRPSVAELEAEAVSAGNMLTASESNGGRFTRSYRPNKARAEATAEEYANALEAANAPAVEPGSAAALKAAWLEAEALLTATEDMPARIRLPFSSAALEAQKAYYAADEAERAAAYEAAKAYYLPAPAEVPAPMSRAEIEAQAFNIEISVNSAKAAGFSICEKTVMGASSRFGGIPEAAEANLQAEELAANYANRGYTVTLKLFDVSAPPKCRQCEAPAAVVCLQCKYGFCSADFEAHSAEFPASGPRANNMTPRARLIERAAGKMAGSDNFDDMPAGRLAHECLEGVVLAEGVDSRLAAYYEGISQNALEKLIRDTVARALILRQYHLRAVAAHNPAPVAEELPAEACLICRTIVDMEFSEKEVEGRRFRVCYPCYDNRLIPLAKMHGYKFPLTSAEILTLATRLQFDFYLDVVEVGGLWVIEESTPDGPGVRYVHIVSAEAANRQADEIADSHRLKGYSVKIKPALTPADEIALAQYALEKGISAPQRFIYILKSISEPETFNIWAEDEKGDNLEKWPRGQSTPEDANKVAEVWAAGLRAMGVAVTVTAYQPPAPGSRPVFAEPGSVDWLIYEQRKLEAAYARLLAEPATEETAGHLDGLSASIADFQTRIDEARAAGIRLGVNQQGRVMIGVDPAAEGDYTGLVVAGALNAAAPLVADYAEAERRMLGHMGIVPPERWGMGRPITAEDTDTERQQAKAAGFLAMFNGPRFAEAMKNAKASRQGDELHGIGNNRPFVKSRPLPEVYNPFRGHTMPAAILARKFHPTNIQGISAALHRVIYGDLGPGYNYLVNRDGSINKVVPAESSAEIHGRAAGGGKSRRNLGPEINDGCPLVPSGDKVKMYAPWVIALIQRGNKYYALKFDAKEDKWVWAGFGVRQPKSYNAAWQDFRRVKMETAANRKVSTITID